MACPQNQLLKTSDAGFDIIRENEGLRLKAYKCPAGIWTVGYGHTQGVTAGMVITEDDADNFLAGDAIGAENIIKQWVDVPLDQNQFDALVSFVFNLGAGRPQNGHDGGKDGFVWLRSGRHSTMLNLINAGNFDGAAQQFLNWNKAGGVVLAGLTKRRKEEAALFNSTTVKEMFG